MGEGTSLQRAEEVRGEIDAHLRQLAEEVRRRSALLGRLDAELAAAPAGLAILLLDGNGSITQASREAAEVVGITDLVGRRVDEVLLPIHSDGQPDEIRFATSSGGSGHLTCLEAGLDGGRRLVVLVPSRAAPGSDDALTLSIRDTLHDLANVFATILGYAELALSKGAEGPIGRYLEEVQQAGQRGQLLVQDAQARIHGREPTGD